ncbi:RNA-directed DNA polymerase-like protein [Cardamine amara subsp. amara]|uniref:RNA-directed DNA polymerase-like protein n=1 Tax=Cardamine amara subsp. amara TaxID=228776 RepID=A0ABD1B3L6_CARAN
MTLPTIDESPFSGETQGSASSTETKRTFEELFKRIREVERGQTTIVTTVTDMKKEFFDMKRDMRSLITEALAQAYHTPAPSPQRQPNQYQEQEYDRFRNPEKQPMFEGSASQAPPQTHELADTQPLLELTKKLEIPIFSGEHTFAWLSKIERFFRLAYYSDVNKMNLAAMSLDGDAIGWYNAEINSEPFIDWNNFKDRLLLRFAGVHTRGPTQTMCCIKQMGSAKEYVAQFEDLAGQVTNLDQQTLEGIFLNGLKGPLRATVEMMKPRNITEMKAYSISLDSTALTKVVAKEMYSEHRLGRSRSYTDQRQTNPSPAPTRDTLQGTVNIERQLPQQQSQPRYLNDKEREEKKRRGLCFKCDGRWSRDHYKTCPQRTLQVLTVIDGYEVELIDRESAEAATTREEVFEDCEETPITLARLSYSSFMGINTPTTTKIRLAVGSHELVALVDSGASDNFISPDTVALLRIPSTHTKETRILLGTGISAPALGMCRDLAFSVAPQTRFRDDFIILELGDADVILGVKWLSKLGTCNCNWQTNEFSFLYNNEVVQLWGEKGLGKTLFAGQEISGRSLCLRSGMHVTFQHLETWAEREPHSQSGTEAILQKYSRVFSEPTSLPPIRNREHRIALAPGSRAISVRPYRYPHAYKSIIEQMVIEMLQAGIIRPSKSPFSSPVLLVRKNDDSWRFCVDYRALNRVTIPDKFLIPVIDQLLDELNGAAFFSKLDLKAGYHQIRMAEEDIHKTAFRTHE